MIRQEKYLNFAQTMEYIIGSVLTSSVLVLLFRVFQKYDVSLIQAITVNYFVCVLCGFLYQPNIVSQIAQFGIGSGFLAFLQGFLFIFMFFQIGSATQEIGVTYTTMIGRLSVVIPIFVSLIFFYENLVFFQWIGLLFAISAIYFMNSDNHPTIPAGKLLQRGSVLFLGNGIIDSIFKIYTMNYGSQIPQEVFTVSVFGTAGILGFLFILIKGYKTIHVNNLIAGIVLGIPNFFSLIFMLKGLSVMEGARFFPINNIGIILVLALSGAIFFQEKLTKMRIIGIFCTIAAIVLLSGSF